MAVKPDKPEALADLLADKEQMDEVFADDEARGDFLAFIADYAERMEDRGAISEEIAAQAAASVTEWLREAGVDERPDFSELATEMTAKIHQANLGSDPITIYNPQADGALVDDVVTTTGEFFAAISHRNLSRKGQEIRNKLAMQEIHNTLSERVPAEGGFLVPERLRAELLRTSLESSVVRSRARVVPMDSLRVPFPAIDETSHASNVYGGIIGYWTEEATAITQSDPKFRQVVLEAKKLAAYTQVPNELVQDSVVAFTGLINTLFPQAIAWFEDTAFFSGQGAGEPLGFNTTANQAVIAVSAEAGQSATTIVWENLVNMYSRMLPSSLGSAVWIANHDTFAELATMALSVGTGGSAIWLNNGASGPPMTILGRPVIFTEKAETLGTVGDIVFADLSYYLVGDRQALSAESSTDFLFSSDQTAFKVIERVDGRPWLVSALTPQNSSSTLSPFVRLATRS